jgi:hypothetical protein
MNDNNDFGQQPQSVFDNGFNRGNGNEALPNATASLVLGIISIVACCIGIVPAIIGLVLANKDRVKYFDDPSRYSQASFNNSNAGRVCSIIGLVIQGILLTIWLIGIATGRNEYSGYSNWR